MNTDYAQCMRMAAHAFSKKYFYGYLYGSANASSVIADFMAAYNAGEEL